MDSVSHIWHGLLDTIAAAPIVLLFIGLVLSPLVGVPVSPLWVAAGMRLGMTRGVLFSIAALVINLSLGYWLARALFRTRLARWMERRHKLLPQFDGSDATSLIVLLRITPGVPLCAQNYLLGLSGVPFGRYLVLSSTIQSAYALAFVAFGQSLLASAAWQIMLSTSALAATALAIRLIRQRLVSRAQIRKTPKPIP